MTTEKRILSEARDIELLALHPGYVLLRNLIRQWEHESLLAVEESSSNDPEVLSRLALRYRERHSLCCAIDDYIQRIIEMKKSILEDMKEYPMEAVDE